MDFSTRSSAFGPAVSSGLRDNQRAPSAHPESGLALRFPDEGESARLSGRLLSRSDLCKGSGTAPGPWDPQTRRPAQEATAPCAASSHPAGFWSLPAPSLAGGRGFRAPLRSRWEVLTEAPRVLAASSPRENVRIVTITKTHRLRQALLLIKPRLLLQLQRLTSRNSWDRRAGREVVGAAERRCPEGRWGPLRARSQEPARALRSDAVNTRPGAAASPQTGPRGPRPTGPRGLSLCIMHRVSQVSKRLGGERVAPAWQLPPSLPAAPCPRRAVWRLRLEMGPQTGTAGPESNRICSRGTCRRARRGPTQFLP